MERNGFSLVELITVIAIAGALIVIGSLYFRGMTLKSSIEGEAKAIYADLVTVRSQALFQKRKRSVQFSGASFLIYSSTKVDVAPATTTVLKYPVTTSSITQIDFDTNGVITFPEVTTVQNAVCVQQANNAVIDSIAVDTMQIRLGKQNGSGCTYANITQR